MLSETFESWLEHLYRPLLGAEEDPNEDPEADPEEDPEGDPNEDPEDDPENDPGDGDDAEALKSKLAKAQSDLAAAQRAARTAKQEARQAREQAAHDSGDWERVANERAQEIEDLQGQLNTVQEEAATARHELDKFQRSVRVTSLAARLHFRDPADAIKMLSDDHTGDDKTAERALRKLVEEKPYLVDQRKASGRGMNGGGGSGRLSREQLESMSPDEINASWEQVSGALAQGG